jgi:hypothetical protein
MQSLAEFMAESFNSNVPLTWDLSGVSRAVASFTVDSVKATVAFERRGSSSPWHVTFEVAKGDSTEAVRSAFAIFNGVFQAVAEFIEVREPETLVLATNATNTPTSIKPTCASGQRGSRNSATG